MFERVKKKCIDNMTNGALYIQSDSEVFNRFQNEHATHVNREAFVI